MKVGSIQGSQAIGMVKESVQTIGQKGSFNEVLKGVSSGNDIISLQKDLKTFTEGVVSGKSFSPRDLIIYQIKAGQFGLGVELVSKVAESASATIKKLEQGH
jgi:hypothetical protein